MARKSAADEAYGVFGMNSLLKSLEEYEDFLKGLRGEEDVESRLVISQMASTTARTIKEILGGTTGPKSDIAAKFFVKQVAYDVEEEAREFYKDHPERETKLLVLGFKS